MEKRNVANTGDFISRIRENIENGWVYPNRVIRHVHAGGKWPHYIIWYLVKDNQVEMLCGGWSNTRAYTDHPKLDEYRRQYGTSYLQSFVKERS